jgi:hypothetical protein
MQRGPKANQPRPTDSIPRSICHLPAIVSADMRLRPWAANVLFDTRLTEVAREHIGKPETARGSRAARRGTDREVAGAGHGRPALRESMKGRQWVGRAPVLGYAMRSFEHAPCDTYDGLELAPRGGGWGRYRSPEWRPGEVCLLLEYCDGGSVASLLGQYGAFPWRIVAR